MWRETLKTLCLAVNENSGGGCLQRLMTHVGVQGCAETGMFQVQGVVALPWAGFTLQEISPYLTLKWTKQLVTKDKNLPESTDLAEHELLSGQN